MNHVKVETTEVAQDLVLGMFLVNSQPATALFDTAASHSFVSARFVAKHSLITRPMKKAMLVTSPREKINTNLMCPQISIKIRG